MQTDQVEIFQFCTLEEKCWVWKKMEEFDILLHANIIDLKK